MGVLDSLPHPWPPLPPEVCETLETAFVRWRWRLRGRAHRLSRTHGDFHPWNILFREGTEFGVLDRSRGEWGEPADDVAALGVNYLFFGMRKAARHGERGVAEPFRTLFHTFLSTYLEHSRDWELLDVLPPFLVFRVLVLAHPRWYPDLPATVRDELIHAAMWLATSRRFDPTDVARLCGAAR
jgi:Ser/Thr protein kinase RdoA (MazF antagonist)